MKPCRKNRKRIAWLVLGALDARREQELHAHLDHCDGCRGYLNEISRVSETLRTTEPGADLQATEVFHRRVVRALRVEASRSLVGSALRRLRGFLLEWRVALPALGVMVAALIVVSGLVRHPALPRGASTPILANAGPERHLGGAPTLASYQAAVNRSPDELDELLTQQATRNPPAAPIYTASGFVRASVAD